MGYILKQLQSIVRLGYIAVCCVVASLLLACDQESEGRSIPSLTGSNITRLSNEAMVNEGAILFQQHCSRCHGRNAEGAADWRQVGPDGFYPPPPLNGSGHAWHHPSKFLNDMIRNGSPPGKGKMPAWRGKLSDHQIEALVAWFQSLWPDRVYAAWYEREHR